MTTRHAHQADTTTSTGVQLANRFSCFAASLQDGLIPAAVGHELARALDKAESRLQRQAALRAASALLNSGNTLDRWPVALALASALKWFEDTGGLRRVLAGHRQPATDLERCLLTILQTPGPRRPYGLWRELKALNI